MTYKMFSGQELSREEKKKQKKMFQAGQKKRNKVLV